MLDYAKNGLLQSLSLETNLTRAVILQVSCWKPLKSRGGFISIMAIIFFWIDIDLLLRDHVCQKLTSSNTKDTFVRVEAHVIASQGLERLLKVLPKCHTLDDDVINVRFNIMSKLLLKNSVYHSLRGCLDILEPKQHIDVIIDGLFCR